MTPRIEVLTAKKLVGKMLTISLVDNRTPELFRSFMPERKTIKNTLSEDVFCLQVYSPSYSFTQFDMAATFEKWAAVEVSDFNVIPGSMSTFSLEGGLYAVFIHFGGPANARHTFSYIFSQWLPRSEYVLDNRPHFEILGAKYKHNEPDSEEEVWIPVRSK